MISRKTMLTLHNVHIFKHNLLSRRILLHPTTTTTRQQTNNRHQGSYFALPTSPIHCCHILIYGWSFMILFLKLNVRSIFQCYDRIKLKVVVKFGLMERKKGKPLISCFIIIIGYNVRYWFISSPGNICS